MTHVLIVDDLPENLYLLRALLQGHGFTVDEARDGAEALANARAHPPDLVVSDLLMPVMDGYTLLRTWKNDAKLSAIPFVVYTATYTDAQDERLALGLGAAAFLLKPAEPESLLAALRDVLANTAHGEPRLTNEPSGQDAVLLKHYSEVLVRKLEDKVRQLEQANSTLRVRTQLYAMLALTNRAVSQSQSRDELFRVVCTIAVETGQFACAWVGVPDAGRIMLVASAGTAVGYMADGGITVDAADPRSHGPTGLAARTGQAVVVNDFLSAPITAPWHAAARQVGFAASAAFPLHEQGQVAAVLNLYAVVPGFFTDSLVATLSDITPNVSFALDRFVEQRERRAAAAALEAKNREMVTTWDSMTDAFFSLDTHWQFTHINRQAADIWQRDPAELLGKNIWEMFPSAVDSPFYTEYQRAVAEQVAVTFEAFYPPANAWREVHAYPAANGLSVYFRDATARKAAETALRSSEQRLALATKSAHLGIWDWDVVTNTMVWDAQMYALYGIPAEDFGGAYEAWEQGLHPDDREQGHAAIAAALDGSADFHTTFRVLWPSGAVRSLEAHGVVQRADDGTAVRMIGVNWDITARVVAEEAYRSSAAEFRTLAEAMPQMVWITRADGVYLYFNQQCLDYTGLTLAESLGGGWSMPFHADDQQRARDVWEHATETSGMYSLECRLRRWDGVYHWWLMRATPLLDASGAISKWFGTCTDIHDLKLAEFEVSRSNHEILILNADLERRVAQRTEALAVATQEAERANHAKSDFLSRMSHELRTPLNAILGFGQLLATDTLTALQHESVGYILEGGRHLLSLINEVLDIARVEAGRLELSIEPMALADIVPDACALLGPLAVERTIRLDHDLTDVGTSLVLADRQRLKQVLLNLLANAIKYNRPGGHVAVTCRVRPNARIQIAVHDTGPGIAPDALLKLFTPFERASAANSTIEGTGLGLVLSKGLVVAMGGTLEAESAVGQGSTFAIELPLADGSRTLPEAPGEHRPALL